MSADVDDDPQDFEEWRDALLSVSQNSGAERARQIMDLLVGLAQKPAIDWQRTHRTPYVNTILVQSQPAFPGDLIFYQPHFAPGIYARAFLEGRLRREDFEHYRQEITAATAGASGFPSYPHPWLMPAFYQFPTGSMGIGPISSIYQARFMRYLQHRGLLDTAGRMVWMCRLAGMVNT